MDSSVVPISPILSLEVEVVIEVVGEPRQQLCPAPGAARIDEVVPIPREKVGERFGGVVWKLTSTGAAIQSSTILPLVSRVALTFELRGVRVEALGIVMWRRVAGLASADGLSSTGRPGFGVLFEAINDEGREAIEDRLRVEGRSMHRRVAQRA
jgi:hypothetical protein